MSCITIDGRAVAALVKEDLRARVQALASPPGLATVLVGDDPASHTYVRSKHKLCAELGIASRHLTFAADVGQDELLHKVDGLAQDPDVHGILVQLPLPDGLDEAAVLARVPAEKDVDGFSASNVGLLAMKGRQPQFVPCTPAGCMRLLEHYQVPLAGARAVVLGRSNIVGLPMAMLLNHADATVTIAHSRTRDLADLLRQADVVVAALGRAEFVRGDMLKPGACVIDVGINRTPEGLVGDVHAPSVRDVAGWLTPVPGGVGPMTLVMLMENTLRAAELAGQGRELETAGRG